MHALQDLLQDSSARLQAAKEDADAKNAEIVAELDKFRRAFTGDPLGWAAATDEQGKPYYYNSETGTKNKVLGSCASRHVVSDLAATRARCAVFASGWYWLFFIKNDDVDGVLKSGNRRMASCIYPQ